MLPSGAVLPRVAQFDRVIALILIVAPHAGIIGGARTRDGGFEAGSLGNDEIGGDAAVGPTANAEFVRIGDALSNGVIDERHVVLKVLIAPIRPDGFAVVLTVAGGAARVWKEHDIAVGGEELRKILELRVVRPYRPAMRAKKGGIFFPGNVIDGLVQVAVDYGAVFRFEGDVLARATV